MTAAPQRELCIRCHDKIGNELTKGKSRHAPVAAGQCSKCHSPHQAQLKKLLLAKSPDLCFACHKSVKDALAKKNTHPPATDDCGSCHTHHASTQVSLLTDVPGVLCAQCHETTPQFEAKHLGIKPKDMNCPTCHNPHASTDPALLKSVGHAPFMSRDCDTCHTGDKRKLP
jgi:predicted CXXCH cytochrome family protein